MGQGLVASAKGQPAGVDALRPKLEAADLTVAITREAYPSLEIPFHSRWRHFAIDGDDRWTTIAETAHWPSAAARARAEFDLAIISVLLDAGAGAAWRYRDPVSGQSIGRSEGLALASLAMFRDGLFSAKVGDTWRADATRLGELTSAALIQGFQANAGNPLPGIDGRANLLRRLGQVVLDVPSVTSAMEISSPSVLVSTPLRLPGAT